MITVSKQISDLVFDPINARKHPTKNIEAIKGSLAKFGQQKPIVINDKNIVIAGNGTLAAAKELGWKNINCVISDLDDLNQMAFALADNRTSELAEWDLDIVNQQLAQLEMNNFDVEILHFDNLPTIESSKDGLTDDDEVPEIEKNVFGVKRGDVWLLGNHRLMCGDSTSESDVAKLMDGKKADMVFTDPPYGINIVGGGKAFGSVGGGKIVPANTYKIIAGDNSIDTAIKAINIIKKLDIKHQIIWGGNYYASYLENSSCWLVWDKENSANFADAELAWTNNKTAVRIFKHMWNGMIKASEHGTKRVHPTQKPIALAEWCFENYGDPKTILDLFLGSGSTLIACEKTGRICYGMELDEHYCSVIIKRWQDFTGNTAIKLN